MYSLYGVLYYFSYSILSSRVNIITVYFHSWLMYFVGQ